MTETMRTTLAIDLDMLQTARERAEGRGETLGKVISDMMRESLATKDRSTEYRNGIKLLPRRDFTRKVTVEDVETLLTSLNSSETAEFQIESKESNQMRTTLTIPDDVLAAARQRAEARGVTVGEALGEIARRGLENELEECEDDFWKGVKFFPHRPDDPPVTLELVNRLRDELP